MSVHFQQGIKMQCKEMWIFLEVFVWGKQILCFQHGTQSSFLLIFAG